MTFFPNNEIRKFFPGFDGTLSIQYHELKLINIVLSYTMPWQNINDLAKNNLIHINFKKQYSALYCDYDCTWLSQGHGY